MATARKKPSIGRQLDRAVARYTKMWDRFKKKQLSRKAMQRHLKATRKVLKRAAKTMPAKTLKRAVLSSVKRAKGAAVKQVKRSTGVDLGKRRPAPTPHALRRGPKGGQYYIGPGGVKIYA